MATLSVTKANGTVVNLPEPQEMTWDIYDVDSDETGRNQEGVMFRDRVSVKRKVSCKFPPMTSAETSTLLNAVTDQFFKLTYPDAMTGANRTMDCYIGDRSTPVFIKRGTTYIWEGVSMNFIEK